MNSALLLRITRIAIVISGIVCLLGIVLHPILVDDSHLFWLETFRDLFRNGIFYPHWLPNSYYGIGAPTFYFYPPLTYFAGNFLFWLLPSLSASDVFRVLTVIAFLLGAISFWYYARSKSFSTTAIASGAILYSFGSFRILGTIIRGALSEHIGFIFIPLIFYGIDRTLEAEGAEPLGVAALAGGWAFLLLSNLPSAAILALVVLVYLVAKRRLLGYRSFILLSIQFALGTLLVSFYFFPLIHFLPFVTIDALHVSSAALKDSVFYEIFTRDQEIKVSAYVLLTFITTSVFWFYAKRTRLSTAPQDRSILFPSAVILTFILILDLPFLSNPLFRYLLPFKVAQIPWRFMGIGTFFCALIWMTRQEVRTINYVLLFGALFTIAFVVVFVSGYRLRPTSPAGYSDPPEYLPQQHAANSDTIYHRLKEIEHRPFITFVEPLRPDERIAIVQNRPYARIIALALDYPRRAYLHLYYWPEWKCSQDGRELPIYRDSLGLTMVDLQKGKSKLSLSLVESPAEIVGRNVSIIILVVWLVWIVYLFSRKKRKHLTEREQLTSGNI